MIPAIVFIVSFAMFSLPIGRNKRVLLLHGPQPIIIRSAALAFLFTVMSYFALTLGG